MNITELDSYNLADAVKFNDQLNPRIWDASEHLHPEVRERLLAIADDFRESLGIRDLAVEDITISGSNAAYTYTPNSDIDLHLVVDVPDDEVYRELFNAKKFQYNEQHDIEIGGADVELYVQDSKEPHISQGVYSVKNNQWIAVPRRVKSVVDDTSTKHKFETVGHQIERAIKSGNVKRMTRMIDKIKKMRQTGLENHGEFGPENLAFKILRNHGLIQQLYTARTAAQDQQFSLAEQQPRQPFVYGFKTVAEASSPDGVSPETKMFLSEEPPADDETVLQDFVDFCVQELQIDTPPTIKLRRDPQWSVVHKTFGRYTNDRNLLEVAWGQRHLMDVLRTVAHELTHRHQHERDGDSMGPDAGETGSPWENEANAQAGVLMRDYGRLHPELFDAGQEELDEGLSWSSLDEGLSVQDKIAIFEEYAIYGNLTESIDHDKIPPSTLWEEQEEDVRQELLKNPRLFENTKDFEDLTTFLGQYISNDIKIGKHYLYTSVLSLIPGHIINLAHFNKPHKLVAVKNNQLFFEVNGEIQPYPESGGISGDLLKHIQLFSTTDNFNKFHMLLKLKFSEWNIRTKVLDNTMANGKLNEGLRSRAAAAIVATLLGQPVGAVAQSIQGILGMIRDAGTVAQQARNITRAGLNAEVQQEIVNYVRGVGGDSGSQNLSQLYQLQRQLQQQEQQQPEPDLQRREPQNESVSGYIPTKRQAQDPRFSTTFKESWKFKSCTLSSIELSNVLQKYYKTISEQTGNRWYPHRCSNLAQFIIKSQRNLIKENADLAVLFKFQQSLNDIDRRNSVDLLPGKSVAIIQVIPHTADSVIELNGFKIPKKIKNIFSEENGDIKYVEFNDGSTYPDQHFIKAGKGGGELEGINTLFFPTQQQADQAVTMIGYKIPDQWQLSTINIDESSVKESASGYIPTKRQAKDPRYSMALSVDIKPGQVGREANKLKLKTDRQGHPQIANPNGLFEQLMTELGQFKKSYTANDFKINQFESIDSYRRWQQTAKSSSRGMTRYHANRYANMFVSGQLVESDDQFAQRKQQAQQFSQQFQQLDQRDSVDLAVGNSISLLSSTAVPGNNNHASRIELAGFVTPKKIVKINLDNNNKIDTLEFSDGSRFPETAEFTTIGGANITNTILFSNPATAKQAFTQVWMLLSRLEGQGWQIEKYLSESIVKENAQLAEVRMAPSDLRKFAASPAAQGIRAGFEAELIFRGIGESESEELEPDMDADERAYSIQQVIDFFQNDDWGYGMSDSRASRVESELDDMYMDWRDEQIRQDFQHDSEDLISDLWLEERPMTERIHDALTDGLELSDDEADAVMELHARRERGEIKGSDMSEDELEMESKYSEARSIAMDILEEDVQGSIDNQDGIYDQALDDYRDNYSGDDDSFFSDVGLRWMSDIMYHFNLDWPYMTSTGDGSEGGYSESSADDLAHSLRAALGVKTKVSGGYHRATRDENSWIFEPDTSLHASDYDDMPVEIISPPMPLEECLKKLEDFFTWAKENDAYANDSTGFHMGVSLPTQFHQDVDFTKLALFLGDEHVLKEFGRSANTYCKSAMSKIQNRLGNDRSGSAVSGALDLMKHNLIELAHRSIVNNQGFGKYTSINPKGNYIEFRSAGGEDYLKDIDKLKNTLLRYARAMSIAGNPAAERNEYAKKLYKLIAPSQPDPTLSLFARWSAGELSLDTLKREWADLALMKERKTNQRWELYDRATGKPVPGQEYNGYTKEEAKAIAKRKIRPSASDRDFDSAYELRNMSEETEWEAVDPDTGTVLGTTKDFSITNATNYFRDVLKLDRFQVREREPEPTSPRAKLARRIKTPKDKDDDQDSEQLQARVDPAVAQVRRDWEFYRAETGAVIDRVSDADMMQANAVRADIVRRYGHPDDSVRMRSVPTEQSAERARARMQGQEQEPNVAQNFTEPQSQQLTVQGVPNWEIYNVNNNQVMRTFFQRDYHDAMVYAGQWLEANGFGLEGYGVRPTVETP